MAIYTIGFTKKNAENFFTLLKNNQVKKVIDVRLNNVSQLAGFAKRDDLIFFLREICNCEYEHIPDLAPTEEILKPYKNLWGLKNFRQKNLEEYLGIQRIDKLSGKKLIKTYQDYLENGEIKNKESLLLHNHEDLIGLHKIYSLIESIAEELKVEKSEIYNEEDGYGFFISDDIWFGLEYELWNSNTTLILASTKKINQKFEPYKIIDNEEWFYLSLYGEQNIIIQEIKKYQNKATSNAK